ncbi:hypothetical protein BH23CHL7_BH23CHL7_05720 [soil metagenome]
MPDLQRRVMEVLAAAFPGHAKPPITPEWLNRPGRSDCGPMWDAVRTIYRELTDGMALPEEMPPRERRNLDGMLQLPGEPPRIVEVDESQHFNEFRAVTLRRYPPGISVAFPVEVWLAASQAGRTIQGGGWAAPKPPLFPMAGGRNRQRAFRDALADILPPVHGFLPTLRIADFEVKAWIGDGDAKTRLQGLLEVRLHGSSGESQVTDGR